MERGRRICFVSPYGLPLLVEGGSGAGGAERQFFLFGRALRERGWVVSFITDKPEGRLTRQPTAYPVFPVNLSYLGGNKWMTPLSWSSLFLALFRARADVYVLKTPAHLLPVLVMFGRGFRTKTVFWGQTTHRDFPARCSGKSLLQRMESWGIRRADLVIAQTREQADQFERDWGVSAKIIPSICEELNPTCTLTNAHEEPNVDVLWVGNQLENKRLDVVLQLASLLPEYRFAVAVKITDPARYSQACTTARALPNVMFLGQVPHIEMDRVYARTRLLLNTSTREGFPNTFLQAWLNGVPVVSLRVDPDGLIEKRALGKVALREDPAGPVSASVSLAAPLVTPLREVLEDESLRVRLGENAKHYVREYHARDRVLPKLESHLAGIMG